MTMITLDRPLIYPGGFTATDILLFGNSGTLDAAGEYVANIYQATEAMTISHAGFRPGTIVGSGAADLRIETVGADGNPSGTLWAANTNIATGALTTDTWALFALTASATIAKGDFFAFVIQYNAGTSLQVGQLGTSSNTTQMSSAYYRVTNTGTPTKSVPNHFLNAVLGSGATTFYNLPGMMPITAETDPDFNSGSATFRYGIRFKVPFKTRFRGVSFVAGNATGDFTVALYDDAGTLQGSLAVDGDTPRDGAPFLIDEDIELAKDTWYRATIEATSVTNVELQYITLPSADYISGTPWGANCHLTSWDGAAWDDTNTTFLPLMQIAIDQIDDGTGTGSTGGGAWTFA